MPDRPWPRRIRLDGDLYSDKERVFHIILRAAMGTAPFVGEARDIAWQLVLNERSRASIELFAASLLPDHLHLLASPRSKSIPTSANSFKAHSTKLLKPHITGSAWQPSYFDRVMRSPSDFKETVRYIFDNPMVAGYVRDPRTWPWTFISPDL